MYLAAAITTPFAEWLNSFFAGYDYAILDFLNTVANSAVGTVLTPIMKAITFLGEKGIIFFLLAVILMLFSKTRKIGVCVFGAVCCGALITNIVLKDLVARLRPFESDDVFRSFWDALGSPAEDGYSFPSGHVTAAAAGMMALCLTRGKKMIVPGVIWVGLMMISRNYLVAHYPSDVLFALIIGVISAVIAWLITNFIFNFLEDNDDSNFCYFILNYSLPIPSFAEIKSKAPEFSFDNIKAKASEISLPEIDLRGLKDKVTPNREEKCADTDRSRRSSSKSDKADWNARWDEYRRSKHAETATEPSVRDDESGEDADVKVYNNTASKVKPESEEIIEKPAPKNTGKALSIEEEALPAESPSVKAPAKPLSPREKAKKSGGVYKGRHEI